MQKKVNKDIKIKTASQLKIAKDIFSQIKKGKPTPIVHFKNLNVLFKQLDSDKTITDNKKKEILAFILKNNEKKILERKVELAELKEKNLQKRERNFDGGFKHKYSLAQFESLQKQVNTAEANLKKAKTKLDMLKSDRTRICQEAKQCRPTWTKKCGQKRGACGWYDATGIPNAQKDVKSKENLYVSLKAKLNTWRKQDSDYITRQKEDAKEARERQEQLNNQEKHEAELKAEGLNLQTLKMEIAKQAEEISKLDAEKKKLETEQDKIQNSKNFGATVTQNIKDNSKIYIVIISVLLLIGSGMFIYNRNKTN